MLYLATLNSGLPLIEVLVYRKFRNDVKWTGLRSRVNSRTRMVTEEWKALVFVGV